MCAGILLLQWQGENFAHRQHLKFCYFQPVHCARKNPIFPKLFSRFLKSFPHLEDVEGGHLCGKFQVRWNFTFAMAWWKLCASTTLEILPLSTCTRCKQKSHISKDIQPIFEIFPSSRTCWRWPFGWEVSGAQEFYFCNGKLKTLRIDNIWNLPLSTCTLCHQKSFISNGIQRILKSLPRLEDVDGGHLGESFMCAGILLLQWQRENFAHRQHLKFCHFQPVHCASRNPISPKIFNQFSKSFPELEDVDDGHLGRKFHVCRYFTFAIARWKLCTSTTLKFCHFHAVHCASRNPISLKVFNRFSKSSPQLEDIEGGHLGGKFHVGRYFAFAIARWKLCASTTFETLPLSTCTLCNQNSYIWKGIQPIFEMFPSARRCWGWAFGWKVSGGQVFYFCNGNVKTLRIDNIWGFATFKLQTVPAKILCLQRYSVDFRNLSVNPKRLRVGIWLESFRCAGILLLQWQGENFAHRQHLKFCYFQHVHCASKNPIFPKLFNRFLKSFPQLEDVEGGHLGGKFQVRWNFTFAMARWKLCASTTFEILPLWTCTRCKQKSHISKDIQPIFEIFPSSRTCWRWPFGWEVSGAQEFYFCNGKVKTLRIDNIWNFATINLYTVQPKFLYL